MGGRSLVTMVTVGFLAYIFWNSDRGGHGRARPRETCCETSGEHGHDVFDANELLRLAPPEPEHWERKRSEREQPVDQWGEPVSVDPETQTGSDRSVVCRMIDVFTSLRPPAGERMDRDAFETWQHCLHVLGVVCTFFDSIEVRVVERASAN